MEAHLSQALPEPNLPHRFIVVRLKWKREGHVINHFASPTVFQTIFSGLLMTGGKQTLNLFVIQSKLNVHRIVLSNLYLFNKLSPLSLYQLLLTSFIR